MPDKKLTDSEIIKALECCINSNCGDCPMIDTDNCDLDKLTLDKLTLDLINRLQAELKSNENIIRLADKTIETANAEIEGLKKGWRADVILTADAKAEAYKEFAERLISKIADVMKHIERNPYDSKDETKGTICGLAHAIGQIKDLSKELAGEDQ